MDMIRDKKRRFFQIISLPIIWSLIIPLIVSDLWFEIYHRICFSLYGLKYVKRRNYIRVDRHKLKYLKWYQKIGCAYCGYANGLLSYWVRIGAMTEQYWCGIMHRSGGDFNTPEYHRNFVPYGDEQGFIRRYK